MQAVILAAGKGTRMNHLTKENNKTMLEVNGKPILAYKLDVLPKEVDEVIFVIGHYGEKIKEYFGDEYCGRRIKYAVQEELNGTGGALHAAKDLLRDKFLVLMGDDLYSKKDLEELVKYDLAVLGFEVEDPGQFGVIKTDEKDNMIEVIEAPHSFHEYKLANTAVYVLNMNFFNYPLAPKKPGNSEFGLPQTMAQMAKDYEIKVVRAHFWFQITCPEDLEKAEKKLKESA
jgi:UDP-N-acetylglucosamine diphosphorylase / glucose-1-phosphate thymidylyltransferase / UDP-N-acetylgalactosamine diphosphorylase / glucosamine-1-phosphate N-acetyltransferase / galactosamine-1-phosphate N-acetyltransferase